MGKAEKSAAAEPAAPTVIPIYQGVTSQKSFPFLKTEGEPSELKFGDLATVCATVFGVSPERKGCWGDLRGKGILELRSLKVHPLRGGKFNEAFLSMRPADQRKWAAEVLASPPSDIAPRVVKEYKPGSPQAEDPLQVFWDLVTIANMPKAVAKVPIYTLQVAKPEVLGLIALGLKDPEAARTQYLEMRKARVIARATTVEVRGGDSEVAKSSEKPEKKPTSKGQKKAPKPPKKSKQTEAAQALIDELNGAEEAPAKPKRPRSKKPKQAPAVGASAEHDSSKV